MNWSTAWLVRLLPCSNKMSRGLACCKTLQSTASLPTKPELLITLATLLSICGRDMLVLPGLTTPPARTSCLNIASKLLISCSPPSPWIISSPPPTPARLPPAVPSPEYSSCCLSPEGRLGEDTCISTALFLIALDISPRLESYRRNTRKSFCRVTLTTSPPSTPLSPITSLPPSSNKQFNLSSTLALQLLALSSTSQLPLIMAYTNTLSIHSKVPCLLSSNLPTSSRNCSHSITLMLLALTLKITSLMTFTWSFLFLFKLLSLNCWSS